MRCLCCPFREAEEKTNDDDDAAAPSPMPPTDAPSQLIPLVSTRTQTHMRTHTPTHCSPCMKPVFAAAQVNLTPLAEEPQAAGVDLEQPPSGEQQRPLASFALPS